MFAIKYAPIDPTAAEVPAGTSIEGYWSSIPSGYTAEDGSNKSSSSLPDLYSALGTTYGTGDGISTNFNVPDSRGRTPVAISSLDTEFNSLTDFPGSETETLTTAQLPAHTHKVYIGNVDDKNFTGYVGGSQYPPSDASGGPYNTNRPTGSAGSDGSHLNIQPSITKRFAVKTGNPSNSGDAVPTGTSIHGYWAAASPPTGYLSEDGSPVSRTTYAALFGLIGTTYGSGDGSTTFNLPDSRGYAMVNKSPFDTEFNTLGKKTGEKSHILTIAEMPSHRHMIYLGPVDDKNWTGYSSSPTQFPPGDAGGAYLPGQVTTSTGGDSAHNNIQPSIVQRYFIKY